MRKTLIVQKSNIIGIRPDDLGGYPSYFTGLFRPVPPTGLSDHFPVVIVCKHNGYFAKMETHKTIKYRGFKDFEQEKFIEDSSDPAFFNLLHISDGPNECLEL